MPTATTQSPKDGSSHTVVFHLSFGKKKKRENYMFLICAYHACCLSVGAWSLGNCSDWWL